MATYGSSFNKNSSSFLSEWEMPQARGWRFSVSLFVHLSHCSKGYLSQTPWLKFFTKSNTNSRVYRSSVLPRWATQSVFKLSLQQHAFWMIAVHRRLFWLSVVEPCDHEAVNSVFSSANRPLSFCFCHTVNHWNILNLLSHACFYWLCEKPLKTPLRSARQSVWTTPSKTPWPFKKPFISPP